MKRIVSLICAVCLVMNFTLSFALTAEEKADLESLIKENASSLNNPSYYIDYKIENAFDNFTVTNYLEDEAKTIFSFNCKAKEESDFIYSEGIKVGNYYIQAFKEGAYYVIDNRNDKVYSLKDAYDNKVINDADLDYLYENCAYKAEERQIVEATTDDEALNDAIKQQVNSVYTQMYHISIDNRFSDLKVYKYYSDDEIVIFRYKSSSMFAIDGLFDYIIGKYGFSGTSGNEYYVYDVVNNKISFLETAYKNGLVNNEVLEGLAESYFQNRVDKAVMQLADKLDTERKIYQTIKAEARVNPQYERYLEYGLNDFTFNVYYKSDLAGGIYIFDFQAKGEAYFCELFEEQIGNYICTYCDSGHYLYAVYNTNSTAKIGKLKDLYYSGEIGDDVLEDFYKNPGGASIRKVGDPDVPMYRELWSCLKANLSLKDITIDTDILSVWDKSYTEKENQETNVWSISNSLSYDAFYDAISHNEFGESDAVTSGIEITELKDNDFRTGTVMTVRDPDFEIKMKIAVRGDVSGGEDGLGDGTVDILDVVSTRSVIVNNGIDDLKTNNFVKFKAADMNSDNEIDILDVVIMRNNIVNG